MVRMSSSSSRTDHKSRNDVLKSRNDVLKSRNEDFLSRDLDLEDVDDSEDLYNEERRSSIYLQNHTVKSSDRACDILRVSLGFLTLVKFSKILTEFILRNFFTIVHHCSQKFTFEPTCQFESLHFTLSKFPLGGFNSFKFKLTKLFLYVKVI